MGKTAKKTSKTAVKKVKAQAPEINESAATDETIVDPNAINAPEEVVGEVEASEEGRPDIDEQFESAPEPEKVKKGKAAKAEPEKVSPEKAIAIHFAEIRGIVNELRSRQTRPMRLAVKALDLAEMQVERAIRHS